MFRIDVLETLLNNAANVSLEIKLYFGWGKASVYVLISKLAFCEPEYGLIL
jgi:hypothetical protein